MHIFFLYIYKKYNLRKYIFYILSEILIYLKYN